MPTRQWVIVSYQFKCMVVMPWFWPLPGNIWRRTYTDTAVLGSPSRHNLVSTTLCCPCRGRQPEVPRAIDQKETCLRFSRQDSLALHGWWMIHDYSEHDIFHDRGRLTASGCFSLLEDSFMNSYIIISVCWFPSIVDEGFSPAALSY